MSNERIKSTDSMSETLYKMSEGNPGGLTVCLRAFKNATFIDPDAAMGGFAPLLSMDTLGIYGSKIWMLYKDVCGERLPYVLAILRAWQLGLLEKSRLLSAIKGDDTIDVDGLAKQVCERLPNFNINWTEN